MFAHSTSVIHTLIKIAAKRFESKALVTILFWFWLLYFMQYNRKKTQLSALLNSPLAYSIQHHGFTPFSVHSCGL